jgi:NTE family protein
MRWTGKKVGLALGGGGVRGFTHIGVLKVLEWEAIEIDLIVGTSAGALIGAAYAGGQTPREIQAKVDAYILSPGFADSTLKSISLSVGPEQKGRFRKVKTFVKTRYYTIRSFFHRAILPKGDFQSLIDYFIPEMDIRQTRIPFLAVTTDLITGEQVVFSEGSLRQAVLASCAVPGAVEPVRQGQWLLADGGVSSLVPVHAARMAGADVVIAVMVDRWLPTADAMGTAQEIITRAGEITANRLVEAELADADVVIRPDVGDLHWMDFSRAGDLVRKGEVATHMALEKINASIPLYKRLARLAGRLLPKSKGGL